MKSRSYVHGCGTRPLESETIGAALDRIAAEHPDCCAVVSRHQRLRHTYAELRAAADRVALGLVALGVAPGDRVALWSPNRIEWLVAHYAVTKAAAVLVPLNTSYKATELGQALRHSGASVLIAAAPASAPSGLATVPGLCDELARVRCGGNGSSGEPLRVVCVGSEAAPGWMRWEDLGKEPDDGGADALRARAESIQFDDPMSIMYTSGTTGSPKGATMSHHSLINSGLFVGDRLRYTTLDRVCLPVPLFHTFGCIMGALAALTHGSAIVLPGPIADPKTCVDSIEDERCTSLYGVPSLFAAILASRSFAADRVVSLRTGIMAGAPCPPDLVRDVMTRLHMPEITICYGMTEAGTVCQSLPDDPIERRVGTVGAVHPHMECAIVDPASGRVRPRGEAGELRSRGYASTSGFWNDEQATRNAVTPSGWMRTGDLAVMHEDGYISVVGRIKDMIVSAGQNILPLEVEDVLRSHPQIREAAIVGVPDRTYGEAVCAWIELREGAMVGADEIRRFCRERIASFKVPRRVCFTDALPRTASGKIQKFRLREMSAIDGALERETVSGQT